MLEVEHAKEPLAHYGRFGSTYDAIVKKLVDVLRDEGIYNREADTVQHVAGSALQAVSAMSSPLDLADTQSFSTYLESDVNSDPTATLALAKLISSAFIIHGTHFTVLKQLSPSDVYDFHLGAIDYIARRVSNLVKQEKANKSKDVRTRLAAKRARALVGWFKVVILLLGPIGGRDALKLKSHMEEAMSGTGAPLLSGRGWEGYRAYEKRLVSIAGKDKEVKEASKKVVNGGRKGKAAVRERTETASPAPEEEEGEGSPSPTPKSRGLKRTPSTGSAKQKSPEQEVDDEDEEAGAGEPEGGEGDADVNGDVDMDAEPEPEPVDINDLILDLDQDMDFAGADFTDLNSSQGGAPGSSQRGRERSESVPVERPAAGAKRRKTGRVI